MRNFFAQAHNFVGVVENSTGPNGKTRVITFLDGEPMDMKAIPLPQEKQFPVGTKVKGQIWRPSTAPEILELGNAQYG